MITLTDQQIDFLSSELQRRGIQHPDLAAGLLDHFCCAIERDMTTGLGFHEAYHKAYMEISPNGLQEIDHALKIIILHQKYALMKKVVFSLGFLATFAFTVGYTFKTMSWPTANMLMLVGALTFTFAFLPMYFALKYKADQQLGRSKPLINYALNLLLVMFITFALPYKQFHWAYESYIWIAAQLLLVFVFFPKVFLGWYRKFNDSEIPATA